MPATKQTLSQNTSGRDPAQAFRFYIEIQGIVCAEFLECSGLSMEREVKRYEEGGTNDHEIVLPGRVKQGNITLKRGMTYSDELWTWFCEGLQTGKVKRRSISIILGNAELNKVRHWNLAEAFPVKWTGASLNTNTMEVAAETLEIAHHGISLDASAMKQPMGQG